MKIRFITKNSNKTQEYQELLNDCNVEIIPVEREINEIQTKDADKLIRHKLLNAFEYLGRAVIVEHTGLYIKSLNNFPGGLTQNFWDALEAEEFCNLLGNQSTTEVKAVTTIGYCDGRRIYTFEGAVFGNIPKRPRGPRYFQWDCVFVPKGETKTFAELGDDKHYFSMRRIAVDRFKNFLRSNNAA